jgi:hypothetical protein
MYEAPTKSDLDRNLSTILHDAHQKARAETARLTSEFASRGLFLTSEFASQGLGLSTSLIGAAVGLLDDIHKDALKRAIPILRDFAERRQLAPSEIANIARPHLQNMGNSVLGQLPSAGFPGVHEKIRGRYLLVFQQRLDGALRDFEIGFLEGRSLVSKDRNDRPALAPSKDTKAEMLTLKPTVWGMGIDLKEVGRSLKKLWQRGK